MKATKPIQDLVHSPRTDAGLSLLEVTDSYIEVKGYSQTKLEVSPAKYSYIDLSDTNFTDSTFNNCSTFRSTVIRCTFNKSRMTGLQLPNGNFKNVWFKNCRLNLTNFRNSVFENCVFEDCDLTEADFGGSQFTNVLFLNCQLDNVEFSNCKNKLLEFEGSTLNTIKGVSGLRGASVSELNLIELASSLARELEITVK